MMPEEISVSDLRDLRASGASLVVLDVREDDELAAASLPGATHVPMNEIPQRLGELAKDDDIAVICHGGSRSAMVANYLRQQGYASVANVAGGIDAWSREIDPTVPRY